MKSVLSFFFIVLSITFCPGKICAQNLILNSGFENAESMRLQDWHKGVGNFYAKNWFQPTACTFDILRDSSVCTREYVSNSDPSIDDCANVHSGNYCGGFLPITMSGYMEHLSGTLKSPLVASRQYKMSFFLRVYTSGGRRIYCNKRIGIKFTQDSLNQHILSAGSSIESPFYNDIFGDIRFLSDYQIEECVTHTEWKEYEFIYTAKGGEQFFTVGVFSLPDQNKLLRQFDKIQTKGNQLPTKLGKRLSKNRSLVVLNPFNDIIESVDEQLYLAYYLIDDFELEMVSRP